MRDLILLDHFDYLPYRSYYEIENCSSQDIYIVPRKMTLAKARKDGWRICPGDKLSLTTKVGFHIYPKRGIKITKIEVDDTIFFHIK